MVAVENLVAEAASGIPVSESDGHIAMPLHVHHGDEGVREDSLDHRSPGQMLQLRHCTLMPFLSDLF